VTDAAGSASTGGPPAGLAPSGPLASPLAMLERMWLIRAFEERASELYARGHIGGLLHLGIGQEGSAVGLSAALAPGDRLFGGHRAHAHALARGADPTRLLAEILGRATGSCGGKGGSMHIAAPEVGFVSATGVVAGNIPLALGAALAAADASDGSVAVAVFGDGAGQAGTFHESLNLASLWGLPVLFVCENNGYAEFSPLSAHTKVVRLARHAETYGIPAVTMDGNDAFEVRDAAAEAIARARSGGGPSFVEGLTYRLRGHYEGDPGKYRELSELADWKAKDPIARFIAAAGLEADTDGAEARARAIVDAATEAALAAPAPARDALMTHVTAVVPR
jgi:acetoin:2,6-dichlorophenolindophenol oxidoreductase subunit alpha